jgi:hypothetical protein
MSSSSEVAERRHKVAELWLRGVPVSRIAVAVEAPVRTVRTDIEMVRTQLQQERQAELEVRRDRSVAVLRKVQQEAWALFHRIDDISTSKIGALNTISSAEERIARLEGTLGPNVAINQTTNVNMVTQEEWQRMQEVIAQALMAHPQARIDVAAALAQMESRASLN